jgi:hypothetical protein
MEDISDRTDYTDDSYIPRKTADTLICGFGPRPIKEQEVVATAKETTYDGMIEDEDSRLLSSNDDDNNNEEEDESTTNNSSLKSICSEDAIVILDEDDYVCGNVHRAEVADNVSSSIFN